MEYKDGHILIKFINKKRSNIGENSVRYQCMLEKKERITKRRREL